MPENRTPVFKCANCGFEEVRITEVICDMCKALNARAEARLFQSIAFGIRYGRARVTNCDHVNKGMWDYSTEQGTDEYGNEYTKDKFNCAACGELMEEERTS